MTIENTTKRELTEEELKKVAGGVGEELPEVAVYDGELSNLDINETPGNGNLLPH